MTRLHPWLARAGKAAAVRPRPRLPRLLRALSPQERELSLLRSELRQLENDPEFAAEWRVELAEGWRRIEFDRALLKVLDAPPEGGGPT